MIKMNHILYPTDFSEHSRSALPYALKMAQEFDSTLHCLHVVDEAYQHLVSSGDYLGAHVEITEDFWEPSLKKLGEFTEEHIKGHVDKIVSHQVTGRPFLEIIRYAQEHTINMIVIATHGHSGLATMLLGSVTEKVVRKAPCPVLTIRVPGHKFVMP